MTEYGIYCEAGDFYVDPWRAVRRAVVTHAHSDHARWGSQQYFAAKEGHSILRMRLGDTASYEFYEFGETVTHHGVGITLYPASHTTGSAQVLIEYRGERCVISGDYKRQEDPTTASFEPVRCHTFITESTFGLPIYRWQSPATVFEEINDWWRDNQVAGRCSVLFAYAVGKAQRLLAGIDSSIGPLVGHGAIVRAVEAYRECGVRLPMVHSVHELKTGFDYSKALVIAPPSAQGTAWMQRFGNASLASASGWMLVRGIRRRRGFERGFVLSDHVDWPGLMQTIEETGADEVFVTHGYSRTVVEHLQRMGKNAHVLQTQFVGEGELDAEENEVPTNASTKEGEGISGLDAQSGEAVGQ